MYRPAQTRNLQNTCLRQSGIRLTGSSYSCDKDSSFGGIMWVLYCGFCFPSLRTYDPFCCGRAIYPLESGRTYNRDELRPRKTWGNITSPLPKCRKTLSAIRILHGKVQTCLISLGKALNLLSRTLLKLLSAYNSESRNCDITDAFQSLNLSA